MSSVSHDPSEIIATQETFRPDLLTARASANYLLAFKIVLSGLLKTRGEELVLKRHGHSYFCT